MEKLPAKSRFSAEACLIAFLSISTQSMEIVARGCCSENPWDAPRESVSPNADFSSSTCLSLTSPLCCFAAMVRNYFCSYV